MPRWRYLAISSGNHWVFPKLRHRFGLAPHSIDLVILSKISLSSSPVGEMSDQRQDDRFGSDLRSRPRPLPTDQTAAVIRSLGTFTITLDPGGTLEMIQTFPPMMESRPMTVLPPRMVAPE